MNLVIDRPASDLAMIEWRHRVDIHEMKGPEEDFEENSVRVGILNIKINESVAHGCMSPRPAQEEVQSPQELPGTWKDRVKRHLDQSPRSCKRIKTPLQVSVETELTNGYTVSELNKYVKELLGC